MGKMRGRFKNKSKGPGLKRIQRLFKDGGLALKVGLLDSGKGGEVHPPPSGEEASATPITMAQLGAIHEFGAPRASIPARPFIGSTFDKNKKTYLLELKKNLFRVYRGEMSTRRALGLIGAQMKRDIQLAVKTPPGIGPPNAPSTMKRKQAKGRGRAKKKSPRQLIDTGRMINAITYAVVKKTDAPTGGVANANL